MINISDVPEVDKCTKNCSVLGGARSLDGEGSVSLLFPMAQLASPYLPALMYGGAAAIFFKKSFKRTTVPLLANMVAVGMLLQSQERLVQTTGPVVQSLGSVVLPVITAATCLVSPVVLKMIAAKDVTSVLLFFGVFLDLRFQLLGPLGPCLLTFAGAVPQFIRRPDWLKAKLQKLRSKLGPMYVAYVTAFSLPLASATGPDTLCGHVTSVMAGVAMGTAIMGAVIYRPDNSETLGFFIAGSKASYRKGVHRQLMITSFMCFCANVWYWKLHNSVCSAITNIL